MNVVRTLFKMYAATDNSQLIIKITINMTTVKGSVIDLCKDAILVWSSDKWPT